MSVTPEQAAAYREELKTLDLQTLEGRNAYTAIRRAFIGLNEGYDASDLRCIGRICNVYIVKGRHYIGVGFDMDDSDAKMDWERAFGYAMEAPSFDKVIQRKQSLNKKQIEQLLEYGFSKREKELRRIYGESWTKLKANERLAIEDMYYQAPTNANAKTSFFEHMKTYAASGEPSLLDRALYELRFANAA